MLALQTIVSRRIAPFAPAVVSVTQLHGGDAWNVIPDRVTIRGTVRCLAQPVREQIAALIGELARGVAETHGGRADVDVMLGYPPTVNAAEAVPVALDAACRVASINSRRNDLEPSMASEDFAFMLQARTGVYAWLGVDGAVPSRPLHNPGYDFNDDALAIGAAYWVALAGQIQILGGVSGGAPNPNHALRRARP